MPAGIEGGYEILEAALPRVVSVKAVCNEPRFMGYRLKPAAFEKDRVTVWNAVELRTAPVRERKREFLRGSPEGIARQLLAGDFPFAPGSL